MRQLLILVTLTVVFASCNDYQKVLKETNVKAKYELAQQYYDAEDYKRALRLFEQIAPKYVGKPQGERVSFFLAECNFKRRDYNTAGYQFERFVKSYPKSNKVVEAEFLGAKSYFELSPNYSLDQTDTDKALAKLQSFVNTYPESEYYAEANQMAKDLNQKKERKAFEIAKQFNKLGEFNYELLKTAIASIDNFIAENPGSIYREEALFIKVEAATNLAINSYAFLQQERFSNAKEMYDAFVKKYPESAFTDRANDLLKKINKGLENKTEEISATK